MTPWLNVRASVAQWAEFTLAFAVVPFAAKGGPVLMAKGGILLMAEIGILYLTIYRITTRAILDCFNETMRIIKRIAPAQRIDLGTGTTYVLIGQIIISYME